jgi:Cys-rich protein (TIGR01571 family)
MSVASSATRREMAHESYVKHIDASHSVRIIVQSVADERNTIRHGAWRSGLCGSLCGGGDGCGSACCLPWICPCVSLAQVASRVGMSSSYIKLLVFFFLIHAVRLASIGEMIVLHHRDEADLHAPVFIAAISALAASTLLFSMGVFIVRHHVRRGFNIPGALCCDIIVSCACSCCALGQMAAHVKIARRRGCCSQPDTLPGYDLSL